MLNLAVGTATRALGTIRYQGLNEVRDHWLVLTEDEFKLEAVRWAAIHYESNLRIVNRKGLIGIGMTAVFVLEAILLIYWGLVQFGVRVCLNSQLSNPLDMSITAYKVECGSGTPDSNTRIRHLGWRKLCGLPCRLIRVGVGHEIPLALLTRFWDTGYHNVLLLMARRVGSGTPNSGSRIGRLGRGRWNGPPHRLIRICVAHSIPPAVPTH